MKKFFVFAVIAITALSFAVAFAQDKPAAAPAAAPEAKPIEAAAPAAGSAADKLVKYYEKWYTNSTVTMDTVTYTGDSKEISTGMAFFKDMDNLRADVETQGQKLRMVHAGGQMWIYIESQNLIMKITDPKEIEKGSPKKEIEEIKDKDTTVTEAKDGENTTFTVVKKDKSKKVFIVSAKDALTKNLDYDEKGTLTQESNYKEWKFEPVKDEIFQKPKDMKEVDMSNIGNQAPAEEPKKEEQKKETK